MRFLPALLAPCYTACASVRAQPPSFPPCLALRSEKARCSFVARFGRAEYSSVRVSAPSRRHPSTPLTLRRIRLRLWLSRLQSVRLFLFLRGQTPPTSCAVPGSLYPRRRRSEAERLRRRMSPRARGESVG